MSNVTGGGEPLPFTGLGLSALMLLGTALVGGGAGMLWRVRRSAQLPHVRGRA